MKATEISHDTHAGRVWTRDLARDLFPGPATPFAWTLLAAPAEAALRHLYADFGATGLSGEPFWSLRKGYVYLNGARIAAADEKLFGAAWLGRVVPPAPSGFLGRIQTGGAIKRVEARLRAAAPEAAGLQTRLARWLTWVYGLKWTQADILQVMEELEPHAVSALQVYLLARAALHAADAQLGARLREWLPGLPPGVISDLHLGVDDLPSAQMALNVVVAARLPPSSPERLATLARCGHRGPGGIRPDGIRWTDAGPLLQSLASREGVNARLGTAVAARREAERMVRLQLRGGPARQFDELLGRTHETTRAADVAWDGLVMLMAAAQRWVSAAAREALLAGLISRPEEVLFLELEELKQVATGEWHAGRSREVQAAVQARLAATGALLPDPCPGGQVEVVRGRQAGPICEYLPGGAVPPAGAVWVAETLDPGCLPFWGDAAALLATGCDVWSPGMIAARGIGAPALAGVGLEELAL